MLEVIHTLPTTSAERAPGVVSVLLIDDHPLIRQGLRRVMQRSQLLNVVGEAGSAADGLHQAGQLLPDVVVVDIRLPDGSGLDVARMLRSSRPTVGIVVVTSFAGDAELFAALEAGANAFVAKAAPAEDVVSAVHIAAARPDAFTAPDLAEAMRRRINDQRPQLSDAQRDVLRLLGEGHSVAGIARRLIVSQSTVRHCIGKIQDELGAANRLQALVIATRFGLLGSQESLDTAAG